MKTILLLAAGLTLASGPVARAHADELESGFFLGGAASVQWVSGKGTWGDYGFEVDAPLSTEDGGPVGFAWTERFILGLKPLIGYRLGPRFSLQASYALNLPKGSQQTFAEYDAVSYYEQGVTTEWTQRTAEILACYHPESDFDYYVYGGLDLTRVEIDVTLWEGVQYDSIAGDDLGAYDSEIAEDDISAVGVVVGAGIELLNASNRTRIFFAAQYSTARTDGSLFGTDGFEVDVGGISVMAGLRWYPFND